jgi:dUTP pyrophosphatase
MANPTPVPCPAKDFAEPMLHKVVTKIVVDDPMFIPQYKTEGAACVDLVANIPEGEIRLNHRNTIKIDCGFSMQLKPGWKANIRARSGLATQGLVVTNGPGCIDADYTGRVQVIVTNVGNVNPITLRHGDRIAQMEIESVFRFDWLVVDALEATARGSGGFGSTGLQ